MTDPTLIAARERVAARYVPLTDSMGRVHESVCAKAIRSGAWDSGALVQAALREVGA